MRKIIDRHCQRIDIFRDLLLNWEYQLQMDREELMQLYRRLE
jgi:hypothetical protein